MDIKKFVLSYYKGASKDFHIARITSPTEALKLHSHNYFQIYYVNGGNLTHHLGEEKAHLTRGDVFILPPDMPHYIEADGKVDFFSVSFLPDFLSGGGERNRLAGDFLSFLIGAAGENIQPKITLGYEDMVFVEPLFHRILTEHKSDRAGKTEMIRSLVQVILSLVAGIYFEEKAESFAPRENENYVLYCVEYIKNHFDEEISLSRMVQLSAMSKSCFCTIFRTVTGSTFKDYLNRYRIEKAVEMIRAGEKNNVAARRCGYRETSTFYRNFHKIMGVSPLEYRRLLQGQAE